MVNEKVFLSMVECPYCEYENSFETYKVQSVVKEVIECSDCGKDYVVSSTLKLNITTKTLFGE